MISKSEMARLRRQMHQRIRVVLAQRRMAAMPVSVTGRHESVAVQDVPRQRADEPAGRSAAGEPAPEG